MFDALEEYDKNVGIGVKNITNLCFASDVDAHVIPVKAPSYIYF